MIGLTSSRSALTAASTRCLSTSSRLAAPASGFFQRPPQVPTVASTSVVTRKPKVAVPHTPPHIPSEQSPNYPTTWSSSQAPRELAMRGPRFEQLNMENQPQPLSAMEMIQREPIRLSSQRIASCDGGRGALGHPKVFINLDKPGPKACPYCGLRYELDHHHTH